MIQDYSRKIHAARMVLFRVQGIFTIPEKENLFLGVKFELRSLLTQRMSLLFRSVGRLLDVLKNAETSQIHPENVSIEDLFVGVQNDFLDFLHLVEEIEVRLAKENKNPILLAKWDTYRSTIKALVDLLAAERSDIHLIEEDLNKLLFVSKRKVS